MKSIKCLKHRWLLKLIHGEIYTLRLYNKLFKATNKNHTISFNKNDISSEQIDEYLKKGYIAIGNNNCIFSIGNMKVTVNFLKSLDFIPEQYILISNKNSYKKVYDIYELLYKVEAMQFDIKRINLSIYKALLGLRNIHIQFFNDIVLIEEQDTDDNSRSYLYKYDNDSILNSSVTTLMNNILLDI